MKIIILKYYDLKFTNNTDSVEILKKMKSFKRNRSMSHPTSQIGITFHST